MKSKEKNTSAKKVFKIAIMIYLASFLIINWNDVSWIFNYQEVGGLIQDFFNPYPSIDATTMDAYFYPNHSQDITAAGATTAPSTTIPVSQPITDAKVNYTDKQNTLEIPKINISVPIVFATSTDKEALAKDLDLGTVFYPGSVYPGETGQMIILGHSAPPGWPTIKHDWVFTDLQKLSVGDKVMIDLNNKQYTYVVKKTDIIKRGGDVPTDSAISNTNVLTLISCWPPGKDYQRIAVTTELQSN